MRKVLASVLTATAAVAAMTVLVSGPVQASTHNKLILDGHRYFDPTGCYNGESWMKMRVVNQTPHRIWVFNDRDCEGAVIGEVTQGEYGLFPAGGSVMIDN